MISRLVWRYGQPDDHEMVGLADAARLILQGRLVWRQVEEAIDTGWDPAAQPISDFLREPLANCRSCSEPR